MLSAFANALRTPDLRKKILFTLFILAVFRLGSVIPTPNVNIVSVNQCRAQATSGDAAGLYQMIQLFSGGALLQLAIFALGIMPYITASIILQLLTVVIPRLEALKKEGASGTAKITQYTRYLTLVLAVLNSTAFVTLAINGQLFQGCSLDLVYDKGVFPILTMILTMTAGTGVIMWLGELITDRGVGNGMSVMIFTQIAAQFPASLWSIKESREGAAGWFIFSVVMVIGLAVMAGVIFMEQAQRRIPVQYAKRMVGRRLLGGTSTYIPIKVNQAGVIPVIFASSMLYLPVLYAQFQPGTADAPNPISNWIASNLTTGSWVYELMFFLPDHLLRLLLRLDHLRPGRGQRQHEEVRRLHPWSPRRRPDRAVPRPRALAAHRAGCAVPGHHRPDPRDRVHQPRHPATVPLRRYLDPDHRRSRSGHREADPEPVAATKL